MKTKTGAVFHKCLYAGIVPPHRDYATEALIFPGTNAREPWAKAADFRFTCRIMSAGREVARTDTVTCDEKGHVMVSLENCMKSLEEDALRFSIMEVESSDDVPLGYYYAHIHRKTGLYFPSPALMFMGDVIYPDAHTEQLENTLFWPGLPSASNTEFRLLLINPYEIPMSIEATAWHSSHGHCSSGVKRVSASSCLSVSLDDWIPPSWRKDDGPSSVCVTAQFKLVAMMLMVNRSSGIFTSADHLHAYQLY